MEESSQNVKKYSSTTEKLSAGYIWLANIFYILKQIYFTIGKHEKGKNRVELKITKREKLQQQTNLTSTLLSDCFLKNLLTITSFY